MTYTLLSMIVVLFYGLFSSAQSEMKLKTSSYGNPMEISIGTGSNSSNMARGASIGTHILDINMYVCSGCMFEILLLYLEVRFPTHMCSQQTYLIVQGSQRIS